MKRGQQALGSSGQHDLWPPCKVLEFLVLLFTRWPPPMAHVVVGGWDKGERRSWRGGGQMKMGQVLGVLLEVPGSVRHQNPLTEDRSGNPRWGCMRGWGNPTCAEHAECCAHAQFRFLICQWREAYAMHSRG